MFCGLMELCREGGADKVRHVFTAADHLIACPGLGQKSQWLMPRNSMKILPTVTSIIFLSLSVFVRGSSTPCNLKGNLWLQSIGNATFSTGDESELIP